jgi:hypothetical protein
MADDLGTELRSMLARRAAAVDPDLDPVRIRQRASHARSVAERSLPLVAAAVLLAIAVVLVAIGGQRGPEVIQPAGPGTVATSTAPPVGTTTAAPAGTATAPPASLPTATPTAAVTPALVPATAVGAPSDAVTPPTRSAATPRR